jgi:hypothetical protein
MATGRDGRTAWKKRDTGASRTVAKDRGSRLGISKANVPAGKVSAFVELVTAGDETTTNTSVRLPTNLRDAANIASELGYAESTTDLVVNGLREQLDGLAWRAALDTNYQAHPEDRPSLATVAQAAAEQYGSRLAAEPDLVEKAAAWVEANRPGGDFDDVLLVAEGMFLGR